MQAYRIFNIQKTAESIREYVSGYTPTGWKETIGTVCPDFYPSDEQVMDIIYGKMPSNIEFPFTWAIKEYQRKRGLLDENR